MKKLHLEQNSYTGKLIVFEGTDGAGKTSNLRKCVEFLSAHLGRDRVIEVKQPTDMSRKTKLFQKMMYSKNHEEIDYRAVQLLTMSDRVQHSFECIIPALKEGKWVVCDRYIYTSLANMLARGYRKERWFFQIAKHLLKPDIVFLAYVDPTLAIERIKARPEEAERYLDEELLKNVAKEFLEMAKREKFVILNTALPTNKAFAEVKERLHGVMGYDTKRFK